MPNFNILLNVVMFFCMCLHFPQFKIYLKTIKMGENKTFVFKKVHIFGGNSQVVVFQPLGTADFTIKTLFF